MTNGKTATHRFALTITCNSARGQTAAATAFLEQHGAYIEELAVFDDAPTSQFFLRAVFHRTGCDADTLAQLRAQFTPVADTIQATQWALHDLAEHPRVLILVSKLGHCLQDLLAAWSRGELPMQPVAVASNHQDMWALARSHEIPYYHLPVSAATKADQEQQLLELVEGYRADIVVLARYMQVFSDALCRKLAGRVVNIHHSFLPGFKGARPYHQAFERGVKLIGATAHFATPELDEGPIIDQATERVDHAHSPEDLLNIGRRLECSVLARALHNVLEHRVFINGQRTVVLR